MKTKFLLDHLIMILGCASMAAGIVIFLSPAQIATGGAPGMAIIANHLTGITPGLAIALINVPLMLLGFKQLGSTFLIRTIIIIVMTSVFTDLLYHLLPNASVSDDRLLNALFGGVLVGGGIGFMFKSGGSSGGWGILAWLIARHLHVETGRVVFVLDSLIIAISALAFRDIETALFGVVGVFLAGQMVDVIVAGRPNAKAVHISCDDAAQLLPQINDKLCTPGAIVHCDRFDRQGGRDLIFLTVKRKQIPELSKIILEHEQEAYMLVLDAIEFHGEEMAQPSYANDEIETGDQYLS